MQLRKPGQDGPAISLVPMIDVLMIMLVFFMVTSTFLSLRMMPMLQRTDEPTTSSAPAPADRAPPLLVRLDADGLAYWRGRALPLPELREVLRARLADAPDRLVLLLPSGHAEIQSFVSAVDSITAAGAKQLRVVRVER